MNYERKHTEILTSMIGNVNKMKEHMVGTVLSDYSSTGKSRPWGKHKANAAKLAKLYRRANERELLISENRLASLESCGDILEFSVFRNGGKRLKHAYFCRNRLCPMCQWRRSLKLSHRLRGALKKLVDEDSSVAFIFATFTIKNCAADKLSTTITQMTRGFSSMLKRTPFKGKIRGYVRTIEVTVNKAQMTYHPHIHALLVVDKSYFGGRGYIKQATWRQAWGKAIGVDYLPLVNVQRAGVGHVVEVAKYCSKVDDLAEMMTSGVVNQKMAVDVLITLHKALKGRRLVSTGGLLKDALKCFDKELEDDSGVVEVIDDVDVEIGRVIYRWTPLAGVYVNDSGLLELPKDSLDSAAS